MNYDIHTEERMLDSFVAHPDGSLDIIIDDGPINVRVNLDTTVMGAVTKAFEQARELGEPVGDNVLLYEAGKRMAKSEDLPGH